MSATAETSRRRSTNLTIVSSDRQVPTGSVARDEVEKRAYQRFLDRGALDGGDIDDWLEAERDLLANAPATTEKSA